MGGVKTDVDGADPDPGPLRGGRGRLRLRPRRQPARRQLAARHADLRPPRRASTPPSARSTVSDAREQPTRTLRRRRRPRSTRSSRARRVAAASREIKNELGETMNQLRAPSTATRPVCRRPTRSSGASRRRPRMPAIDDTGHGLQPGRARRDRARLHARLSPRRSSSLRSSARSRAGPSSAPTSPSATTTSGSSTSTSHATAETSPTSPTRRSRSPSGSREERNY